jgi:hypothetical protein
MSIRSRVDFHVEPSPPVQRGLPRPQRRKLLNADRAAACDLYSSSETDAFRARPARAAPLSLPKKKGTKKRTLPHGSRTVASCSGLFFPFFFQGGRRSRGGFLRQISVNLNLPGRRASPCGPRVAAACGAARRLDADRRSRPASCRPRATRDRGGLPRLVLAGIVPAFAASCRGLLAIHGSRWRHRAAVCSPSVARGGSPGHRFAWRPAAHTCFFSTPFVKIRHQRERPPGCAQSLRSSDGPLSP